MVDASVPQLQTALAVAEAAFTRWNATPVAERAACLERAADLFEHHQPALLALALFEAGKTLPDGIGEVREAVDFCRYYANSARALFQPQVLPGPTGESNILIREGRGIFACISPWNFPLSIFTGQIAAALVAGNTVIAKPAEQTPLMAAAATALLHEAGVPQDVLQLLPGKGEVLGAALTSDPRISGVAFTGGTATALAIARSLAAREAPIAAFIAETGGLNAMLVDSSALLEQVVVDVLTSAFQSAGQRCSALRLLLVQEDIAEALLHMLKGAMAELVVGDPALLATDVGPVIDADALAMLQQHVEHLQREATLVCAAPLSITTKGYFFAPRLFELHKLAQLPQEVFGPVLHVLRYPSAQLGTLLDELNQTGYGLTFGIQSRIDSTITLVQQKVRAGNIYVNRAMIGAVPGVQPFGGMGLSGTGPKAGGPDYVRRFAVEKTLSVNTAAAGGNATLMTLQDE
jgi:RHH-type proline utilization regulon transcriptional repressor/proline dehydrogenase/delta 1-pyrroline-5-carboxylate dehydrogenase